MAPKVRASSEPRSPSFGLTAAHRPLAGGEAGGAVPAQRESPPDGEEHERRGGGHRAPDDRVLLAVDGGDPEQEDAGDGGVDAQIDAVQAEDRLDAHGAPRSSPPRPRP